jgi:hypothetical protein
MLGDRVALHLFVDQEPERSHCRAKR